MIKKIKSVFINRLGAWEQRWINLFLNKKQCISHNRIGMVFFTPNAVCRFRVKTFSSKEPETLSWIDSFDNDTVMWDVGANIGLYSIYAAKAKNVQVVAFEPSVFNLEFLAKNIHVNQLQKNIVIFPLALSSATGINLFKMNDPVWGGALSSFGVDFNQHGKDFDVSFEYSTLGLSADRALDVFNIPRPDYLKIDVDGIEHFILEGAGGILKMVKSVLVEIDNDFEEQNEKSRQYLSDSGLVLREKHILLEGSNQFNQLWIRE